MKVVYIFFQVIFLAYDVVAMVKGERDLVIFGLLISGQFEIKQMLSDSREESKNEKRA